MAYGSYDLNTIQLGREVTAGTGVAATAIWRGAFSHLQDTSERTTVEEQIGLLVSGERTYQAAVGGQLTAPSTPLTFEQILHLYEAGIETVSPTGAGPYVYSYAYPTSTTLNTIKTYTLESGNVVVPTDALEMPYSFVESMTFSGSAGEAWTMEGTWRGHQPVSTTLTPALSVAVVEECLVPRTKLYIDATGGTIGSTQKTGVFMGGQIQIDTGIRPVPVGDGNLSFAAHKFVKPTITFTVTIELEETGGVSLVDTERQIMTAGTVRLFRIQVVGSGTSDLVWDFAGVYDSFSDYENADGNTTVTLSGHAVYSSTDALFFESVVTNSEASVP